MNLPKTIDILTIVGARPQFIKASVVSAALKRAGLSEVILHTGQHFDYEMNSLFFKQLNIPEPIANLEIGGGSQAHQTGEMMKGIERFMLEMKGLPKSMLLYGDTNSTLAGALVASKMGIPIIHIEAGLRSFNRAMPEEVNRIVTDRLSQVLFCPSEIAVQNLKNEGITEAVHCVGDVMFDAFTIFSQFAQKPDISGFDWKDKFGLLTLHRPSNAENVDGLKNLVQQVGTLSQQVIWPVHPRLSSLIQQFHLPHNLHTCKPMGYLELLFCLQHTDFVITDSGGLQKEAYWARKLCFTVRTETEWVETIQTGWNQLINPMTQELKQILAKEKPVSHPSLYENGLACEKIVEIVKNELS